MKKKNKKKNKKIMKKEKKKKYLVPTVEDPEAVTKSAEDAGTSMQDQMGPATGLDAGSPISTLLLLPKLR